jgi:hypothetical protein
VYIQRRNVFSDEDIASYNRDMEEQKLRSTESKAIEFRTSGFRFSIFLFFLSLTFDITDEDEVLEQGGDFIAITMYVHGSFEFPPTPIFFCRVTPCYHPGACNQFADCPCYQKKQRCQRGCRCAKTCKLKTMILNYIPLLKCRRRTALQRLSLLS